MSPSALLLHRRLLDWYAHNARDLPWRRPGTSPYAVLVSEVMLQQTPVSRVLPAYSTWLQRWPTVAALATASSGDAVRVWGRLGYPRRALRLQQTARVVASEHGGELPRDVAVLRTLPGIGDYTAAAVAAFAYRQRHAVLDTNVRRVLSRLVAGDALPPPSVRREERAIATALLPADPETAATWSVAVMELGALVCTASTPRCTQCPVADVCRWREAGHPAYGGPPRPRQAWHGTDRQCRGQLLAALRDAPAPLTTAELRRIPVPEEQRQRALAGLLADGLVEAHPDGRFALPE